MTSGTRPAEPVAAELLLRELQLAVGADRDGRGAVVEGRSRSSPRRRRRPRTSGRTRPGRLGGARRRAVEQALERSEFGVASRSGCWPRPRSRPPRRRPMARRRPRRRSAGRRRAGRGPRPRSSPHGTARGLRRPCAERRRRSRRWRDAEHAAGADDPDEHQVVGLGESGRRGAAVNTAPGRGRRRRAACRGTCSWPRGCTAR